jgi:hypothetical protein
MELATGSDLRREIGGLRTEPLAALELPRRDTMIRLGGMIIIAAGVLLAAVRYMPHP